MHPIPGQTRWRIESALFVWLSALVGQIIMLQVIVSATDTEWERPLRPWQVLVSTVPLWVPALVGLVVVSRRAGTGRPIRDYLLRFRWSDLAIGIPIGVLAQLVMLEALYAPLRAVWPDTFGREQIDRPARELIDSASGVWLLVLFAIIAVGAPIVEELLYRGLIFGALSGRLADGLAVCLSAVWFALAHFQGVQTPGLIAVGVVFALCRWRSGRLGLPIVAHSAFNATAMIMLLG